MHQTRDSISTVYDGEGFKSSCSGNGAFKTQFNVAGTYFYSSGPVDPYGVINMKGRVIVNDLKTDAFDVKVQVGGFTAPYNKSDNIQSHSSSSDCLSGVTSGITSCAGADLLPSNQSFFRFTFGKCSTPKVTSISPNRGKNSTVLTINGVGFGNEKCFNEVKIGSHDCAVQNSSENEITCLVTTAERQLAAGKTGVFFGSLSKDDGYSNDNTRNQKSTNFGAFLCLTPQKKTTLNYQILGFDGNVNI